MNCYWGISNGLATTFAYQCKSPFFRVQVCHILAECSILVVAHWRNESLLGIYNSFASISGHLCNTLLIYEIVDIRVVVYSKTNECKFIYLRYLLTIGISYRP